MNSKLIYKCIHCDDQGSGRAMWFVPTCRSFNQWSKRRCCSKYSLNKHASITLEQCFIILFGTLVLSASVCNSFYSNTNYREAFDGSIRRCSSSHAWGRILLPPTRTNFGHATQKFPDIVVDVDDVELKVLSEKNKEAELRRKINENGLARDDPILSVEQNQQQRLLPPFSIVQLPPWLSQYYSNNNPKFDIDNNEQSTSGGIDWKHYVRERTIAEAIEKFEFSLVEEYGLSLTDVKDIVDAIYTSTSAAASSTSFRTTSRTDETTRIGMILGLIDFVNLVLQNLTYDTQSSTTVLKPTREFVIASVLHYVECTSAQLEGATQIIKNALFRQHEPQPYPSKLMLPTDAGNPYGYEQYSSSIIPIIDERDLLAENDMPMSLSLDDLRHAQPVIIVSPNQDDANSLKRGSMPDSNKDFADSEIWSIVDGAARIKRAEILVQSLSEDQHAPSLTAEEAARIRGLLLTIGGDWRALALRCVASLYRLDGILHSTATMGLPEYGSIQLALARTPEVVRTAREALRVYSTLAEQLGLHRLKSELEDRAFKVLYRRQYKAVMSLYASTDCERNALLQQVATFLEEQVQHILTSDEYLMSQIEHLQITSRVKEPYSFWRKLLKSKNKSRKSASRLLQSAQVDSGFGNAVSKVESQTNDSESDSNMKRLSVTDVHDTIALRVILRGQKGHQEEPDNETWSREESLCYYVQDRLMECWPVSGPDRIKDYIRKPKANGYMSLHFTAHHKVTNNGCAFPFEIQIRSERMHEIAEFGVASHWGYKSGDLTVMSKRESNLPNFSVLTNASSLVSGLHSIDLEENSSDEKPNENQSLVLERRTSYLHALEGVRENMARHQVYVFTTTNAQGAIGPGDDLVNGKHSRGRLVSVPIKSKVRQVLEAMNIIVQPDWKKTDPYILHNGRVATMDELVENGDILMIQS